MTETVSAALDTALTSAFLSCASKQLEHLQQPTTSFSLRDQVMRTLLPPLKQPLRLLQKLQVALLLPLPSLLLCPLSVP
jgi:hypothetical protein